MPFGQQASSSCPSSRCLACTSTDATHDDLIQADNLCKHHLRTRDFKMLLDWSTAYAMFPGLMQEMTVIREMESAGVTGLVRGSEASKADLLILLPGHGEPVPPGWIQMSMLDRERWVTQHADGLLAIPVDVKMISYGLEPLRKDCGGIKPPRYKFIVGSFKAKLNGRQRKDNVLLFVTLLGQPHQLAIIPGEALDTLPVTPSGTASAMSSGNEAAYAPYLVPRTPASWTEAVDHLRHAAEAAVVGTPVRQSDSILWTDKYKVPVTSSVQLWLRDESPLKKAEAKQQEETFEALQKLGATPQRNPVQPLICDWTLVLPAKTAG